MSFRRLAGLSFGTTLKVHRLLGSFLCRPRSFRTDGAWPVAGAGPQHAAPDDIFELITALYVSLP
jgi:hypothetical protein